MVEEMRKYPAGLLTDDELLHAAGLGAIVGIEPALANRLSEGVEEAQDMADRAEHIEDDYENQIDDLGYRLRDAEAEKELVNDRLILLSHSVRDTFLKFPNLKNSLTELKKALDEHGEL